MLFGTMSPLSTTTGLQGNMVILPAIFSPSPVSRFTVSDAFSASGAIVIDAHSGKEVFTIDADRPRSMGSLAKLMTAIVILEHHELQETVRIPGSVTSVAGNVVRLRPGESYTVEDMLAALLIASANDAAHALALFHSGSTGEFAAVMNDRARVLGLTKTIFENPMGFDSLGQLSTPRELAWLALYALKNDVIRSMTERRSYTIHDVSGEHAITLINTNQLLTTHPSHFFGLKTGTTDLAGQCLIALAEANGRSYIIVVIGSADRYRDTLDIFDSLSLSLAHAVLE
jgi:serine-type D-Ala-D-Ala carboxypeptidase (penicillin-binding protein 5/6)